MVERFVEITADLAVISLPAAPARCLLTTTMNIHPSLTNVVGRMHKHTCVSTHRGVKRQRNFGSVFPIFPPRIPVMLRCSHRRETPLGFFSYSERGEQQRPWKGGHARKRWKEVKWRCRTAAPERAVVNCCTPECKLWWRMKSPLVPVVGVVRSSEPQL